MTERSTGSDAIIAIGKRLVVELDLDNSVDTLARWMAHHVAELMHAADDAVGDDRIAKEVRVRDAILAIWAHRSDLPINGYPLNRFEPILRTLTRLDPENQFARYSSMARAPHDTTGESEEARQWLLLANGLDQASKVLIEFCLSTAAEAAIDQSKEWVELAKEADLDDSVDFFLIRLLKEQSDLMKEPDPNAKQRRALLDRKNKLEMILSSAAMLGEHLDARLDSLPPAEEAGED